jgi:hypothetical protein
MVIVAAAPCLTSVWPERVKDGLRIRARGYEEVTSGQRRSAGPSLSPGETRDDREASWGQWDASDRIESAGTIDGQRESEGRTLSGTARHPYVAAVQLHQGLAQRQTEAQSA